MINTMVESCCWLLTRGLNRPAQFLGPYCVGRGVPSIFAGNSCRGRCTVRPKLMACCHFHHALIDVNCDDITWICWPSAKKIMSQKKLPTATVDIKNCLLEPGRLLSGALQSQQACLQLTSFSVEGECQAYLRAALGGVNRGAHRGSCVLPRCFLACESLR